MAASRLRGEHSIGKVKRNQFCGGKQEKRQTHPNQKRAREAMRAERWEGICANTDFTCNSFIGSGIFITKKSLIKVSRDLP